MKKFLLTLATVFAAFGAFAAEYPVVTSVEELALIPIVLWCYLKTSK